MNKTSEQSTEYIDFRQYLFAIRRNWLPATVAFGSVVVLASLYTFLQKPIYEAKGKLLIKQPSNITSALKKEDSDLEKISAIGRESDPLSTQAELVRSVAIAQKTTARLKLEQKPNEFLEKLSVQPLSGTDILVVSYKSPDPKKAAAAVNEVMTLYLLNNIIANRAEASGTRDFITLQLPRTQATVHQAEVALRRFEEENHVADIEEEAKSALDVIADLEKQLSAAQAKLADATSQTEALHNKLGMNSQQAIAASSASQAPGVQKALEELQQVESQLVEARNRFQENHPKIAELKSKKASLEALLQGRVAQVAGDQQRQLNGNLQLGETKQQIITDLVRLEAESLGFTSQVNALSRVLSSYKQRMNVLPRLKQQRRELERELQAAQGTYETLLRRVEEIRVEENRDIGNARLAEKAEVPEEPIAPNTTTNLALGTVLGILLAIGTALLLDALNTSIKSVQEAREVFGYTLLGLIPFWSKSEQTTACDRDTEQSVAKIVLRDMPRSPISEAYRMLQANLKFLSSDEELKVVVVTSSVPQEGKSTVSANLAVAIAHCGRRVLLVDGDMRRPQQHTIWNLLNQAGLSNVLVGQAEVSTGLKEVMMNLDVLTAGVTPPNPMALLDSKRMAGLIEKFTQKYDFVIIDTPSLNVAADAPILGKMADGILLVVRPGVVDSASAAAAKEFLEQSGQKVLGQVVNGVTSESKLYNYKEYYTREDTTGATPTSETRKNSDELFLNK